MRYLTAFSFAFLASAAFAAPTIKNVTGINNSSASSVFADSENDKLLWVTPPLNGTLRINQRTASVDEATCRGVSAVNSILRSLINQENLYQEQIEVLIQRKTALLTSGGDTENLVEQLLVLDEAIKSARENAEKTREDYSDYSHPAAFLTSGGYYSFVADSGWSETLTSIKADNAEFVVNPIQTSEANFGVSILGAEGFQQGDVVLDVRIADQAENSAALDQTQVDVEVSKIGACFLAYPNVMGGTRTDFQFGVVQNYSYPFLITTRVSARYNLNELYELFKKTKKKRRLFSSKTYRETIESRELDEVLEIEVVFEDVNLTTEEKFTQQTRIKEFLVASAVKDMVSTIGDEIGVGPNGLQVGAEELSANCGDEPICKGIASGLKVLDSIFGSSTTEVRLQQSLNVFKSFSSEERSAILVPGSIGYVAN